MSELVPNPVTVAVVTAYEYGPGELSEDGVLVRPILGVLPGVRFDVQAECLAASPGLAAFAVTPAAPVHDCGINGVRLYAPSEAELIAAAPPTGGTWDIWVPMESQ